MLRAESIRRWLERNKIFFEVFASVVLGAMAVIVSVASLRISSIQATLQRVQMSPAVTAEMQVVYDEERNSYTGEVLTVTNNGSPLSEFRATLSSMYEVSRDSADGKSSVIVPVGYLCCSFGTGAVTGLLMTYRQSNNNGQAARIEGELREATTSLRSVYYGLRLLHVLDVSYKDLLGESHRRLLIVHPVFGSVEPAPGEVQRLMTAYSDNLSLAEDISKVTAAKLLAALNTPPHK